MTLQTINTTSLAGLSPSEQRQYKVICAALWGYYHKDQITYSHVRGRDYLSECKAPPIIPSSMDCSAYVTYCYDIAGCPDPNGRSFDGETTTGTLWSHGTIIGDTNVKESALQPGDLIFYAYDGPLKGGDSEHVAIYISDGMVVSMGSDSGPLVINFQDEAKYNKPIFGARRYDF
jgi:hypothetical protein